MSEFCGWLGYEADGDSKYALIRRMASRLRVIRIDRHRIAHAKASALAISPDDTTDFHQSEAMLAAVEGRPYWLDGQLAQLAQRQGMARTIADTYRKLGMGLFKHLRGTYALAIVQPRKADALLAVDRMGIRPMTYAVADGALVFGSNCDSVRSHPCVRSTLDLQAIFEYLFFHVVPSPRTVYTGLRKLEPAQYVHYRRGDIQTGYHWNPQFQDASNVPMSELREELHERLRRAIKRSDPDCRAGAFLSGGLDSSSVCGVLAEACSSKPKTYSIGFDIKGYDEIEYARIAARHFQTDSREYYVTPGDVTETMPFIASVYDEPFGNSSALPVFCCARSAKADAITVLLAGDGGDELFAGNPHYAKQQAFEFYFAIPPGLRRLIESIVQSVPGRERIVPVRKIYRYIQQAKIPLPQRLETYNLLHMIALDEILEPDFLRAIDTETPARILQDVYGRANSTSAVNRMLYLDWKFTLADNDLRKVNQMCTAAGIEVRYPMLDDELVEFSATVPPGWKLKNLKLRYFYKQALADFLPPQILRKRKHGFGLPFGEWLRSTPPLQELTQDCLGALKGRGYVRPAFVGRVAESHRAEHAGFYGSALWVLVMLELWLRAHSDSGNSADG